MSHGLGESCAYCEGYENAHTVTCSRPAASYVTPEQAGDFYLSGKSQGGSWADMVDSILGGIDRERFRDLYQQEFTVTGRFRPSPTTTEEMLDALRHTFDRDRRNREYDKRMSSDWMRGQEFNGWGGNVLPEDMTSEEKAEWLLTQFRAEDCYRILVRALADMEDLESVMMIAEADLQHEYRENALRYERRVDQDIHHMRGSGDYIPGPEKVRRKRPHEHLRDDPAKKRPK